MRFLVIMKRFGANKDMVLDNFGRQVKIFEAMSELGHKVDFLCPDYKSHEYKDIRKKNVTFHIRPYSIPAHFRFLRELKKLIRKSHYDYIVGSSDPLLGILGSMYAGKFGIKYIYDMQDDYSCYSSYKIPFVRHLDRKAVKGADIVLTVSDSLNRHVKTFRKKPVYTIQNGVDPSLFRKMGREKARKRLNLPKGKIIIYVGEISRFKGADVLLKAFGEVKKRVPEAYLLLSGKVAGDIDLRQDSVIYEPYPEKSGMITALNAADVAVLPNTDSIFSRHCFPYKLPEYMAIGLPIVATDLGDASKILSKFAGSVCRENDSHDMAEKLIAKLRLGKKVNYGKLVRSLEWGYLARKIEGIAKNDKDGQRA